MTLSLDYVHVVGITVKHTHHLAIVLLPLLDWVDESYAAQASPRLMRVKWYFWLEAERSKCTECSQEARVAIRSLPSQFDSKT